MRTTVVLDPNLVKKAKRRAIAQHTTLSEVINQALREILKDEPPQVAPFAMMVFGGEGEKVHHEPIDFDAEIDRDAGKNFGR